MNFLHLLFIVFIAGDIFGLKFSSSGDGDHHELGPLGAKESTANEGYHGTKDRQRISVSYNGKVWLCETVTDGTGKLLRLADCIFKDNDPFDEPTDNKDAMRWEALVTVIFVSIIMVVVLCMFAFELYDRCLPCNCFADGAGRGG